MGKRLSESIKLIEKDYHLKVRKAKWEQTLPTFRNLEIDISYKNNYDDLILSITDILNVEDKRLITTKIKHISQYRSNYIISNIQCPCCGKNIPINKLWNCYICECDGTKKIFEIKDVWYPKPKQIVELPNNDYE